jgi:hypothetical protein
MCKRWLVGVVDANPQKEVSVYRHMNVLDFKCSFANVSSPGMQQQLKPNQPKIKTSISRTEVTYREMRCAVNISINNLVYSYHANNSFRIGKHRGRLSLL